MLACSKWKMWMKKFLLVVPLLLGILFVGDTSAFAEGLPEYVGDKINGRVTYRGDATSFLFVCKVREGMER